MNATTAAPPPLPNLFTPMAFLPPELAYQYTISTYVYVGTLGVLVWDILFHLRQDYPLVFRYPVRLPGLVYLLSRMAALAFILSAVIYQTAPVGIPCRLFSKVVEWLFAVAVPSTSLLFLFRVLAIFDRNKFVCAFFSVMWLCVVAGVITPTQGLIGANIGPTKYCINVKVEEYVGAAAIIPLVNDTLVFLAISWKLMRNTHTSANPLRGNLSLRALLRGDYLPAFSRGLLQDGQVYYLTTVTTNLMTVIIFYFTFVPAVYRAMFAVPNAVLMNMMACRVYRRTKLARYKELKNPSSNPSSSMSNGGAVIPLAFPPNRNGADLKQSGEADDKHRPFEEIKIVKTVTEHDGVPFNEEKGHLNGGASVAV
ncbi:unnamed protein product [Cyclocybe aegerita]|uniref:Uncharacterized protein n=1 Tax=Cyclocybe aegerita TaxID=1973307 RepID=A0A8S0WZ30_CYCAE|nr:unnamed protein product [Cyclocybe aegerita]